MSVTKVGVVYAKKSKLVLRIFIPDQDDAEIDTHFVNEKEQLRILPIQVFRDGGVEGVRAAMGLATISGVCAVVDGTNTVIDKIIADPDLYTDPRGQVIASDRAIIGDQWNGTNFRRQYAEVSSSNGNVIRRSTQNIDHPIVLTSGSYLVSVNADNDAQLQVGMKYLPDHKVGTQAPAPSP